MKKKEGLKEEAQGTEGLKKPERAEDLKEPQGAEDLRVFKRFLELSDEAILRDHLGELQRFYSLFFETACSSCKSQQRIYLQNLRNLVEKQVEIQEKKLKFRLQKGFLIRFAAHTGAYSNENLTDEIALNYLKINPNRIEAFKKYPPNWKTLLEKETL